MPILRYVILPLVTFGIACFLFWEAAKRYQVYVFGAVAIWIVIVLIRAQFHKKRDSQRG